MLRLLELLGDEAGPAGEDRYAADGLAIETCLMTLTIGIAFARDRRLAYLGSLIMSIIGIAFQG